MQPLHQSRRLLQHGNSLQPEATREQIKDDAAASSSAVDPRAAEAAAKQLRADLDRALRALHACPWSKAIGVEVVRAAGANREEELLDALARMLSEGVEFATDPLELLV